MKNTVKEIEQFLTKYVTFPSESGYSLPLALFAMFTHAWPDVDVVPYICITADTKRSGKTRAMELLSFVCANSANCTSMSAAAMYNKITNDHPVLFIDEAEQSLDSENSELRPVVNVGYRRGTKVQKMGKGGVIEYDTFCPKVVVMIGDPYDTLRDRSLIVRMRRAEPAERFRYEIAKAEGDMIREEIHRTMEERKSEFIEKYLNYKGISFMTDRDEEIWTPLFIIAEMFCPNRINELSRIAVDMATEKTSDRRRYVELLRTAEKEAEEIEYSERLLRDLHSLLSDKNNARVWTTGRTKDKVIPTADVIDALKSIPTAPWRKFRGTGLDAIDMGNLLARYGVAPMTVRVGSGKESKTMKGYKKSEVDRALATL